MSQLTPYLRTGNESWMLESPQKNPDRGQNSIRFFPSSVYCTVYQSVN